MPPATQDAGYENLLDDSHAAANFLRVYDQGEYDRVVMAKLRQVFGEAGQSNLLVEFEAASTTDGGECEDADFEDDDDEDEADEEPAEVDEDAEEAEEAEEEEPDEDEAEEDAGAASGMIPMQQFGKGNKFSASTGLGLEHGGLRIAESSTLQAVS